MVKKVSRCRICDSRVITRFLALGDMPLPNGFLTPRDLKKKEKRYPLNVGICHNCSLVQLMEIVDPQVMFRNYVYIPSTSKTRMDNFSQIASQAKETVPLDSTSLVIDIGSNDGSLLSFFKGYGIRTVGIDPAANLAKIAKLKGIETVNDYISLPVARKLVKRYGQTQVITATNVVAHIDNLHDLFAAVELLLSRSGIFIAEFPYLVDIIEQKLFDTIYHEHLSYFSIKPLLTLIKQHNLKLIDIKRTSIDGGALRLTLVPIDAQYPEATTAISNLLSLERKFKLDQFETYLQFAQEVSQLREEIRQTVNRIKKQKLTIVGYGASARGNILLSYCRLSRDEVDFIVDSTPYKQGLFTPGHHIPIYPEEALLKNQPDYSLILAWNFANEIIEKQPEYFRRGGKFIIPVPKIEIIKTVAKPKRELKVVVVMPAYNAAKTLLDSYQKIPKKLVDEIILVDDASTDKTYEIAKELPITVFRNEENLGYGGNLKVCLSKALERKADIIIEYHPDDQYDPKDLPLFIQKAKQGYDFALGSRFIFPKEALANKMPLVKFVANRAMSFIDELILGIEMSEFHSGFRMYTRKLLESVPFYQNSDDYLFSFEIIVQAVYWNFRIAEVPISCRYHPTMHTADLRRSAVYALGTFRTLGQYMLAKFFRFQRGPFLLIKPAPCSLCQKKLTRFEYVVRDPVSGELFSIFFCSLCQIGFTVPMPKNLSPYYPPVYYTKLKTLVYRLLQTRRPLLIHRLLKKGKLLDIGCGDGSLSQQLDLTLYSYTGIETSFINSRNPLVKPVGIEGMHEPDDTYQAVMFWESFEHLKNPLKALEKVKKTLKKNGYLIIECPNFSSWEKSLFASRWFHLDPPRHLYHYTPQGLKSLLEGEGFRIETQQQVYAPEYTPMGFAQSVLFRFSPYFHLFYKHPPISRLFLSSILVLLTLVFLPISYIMYLCQGSPIQLTVASKRK